MIRKKKIVFILGAGFSKAAGYPLQDEILEKVLKLKNNKRQKQLRKFIIERFQGGKNTPLEDVYTSLDKSILEGRTLGGFGPNGLRTLRNQLDRSIARIFSSPLPTKSLSRVSDFAYQVYRTRVEVGQDTDAISIITTNWDFLIENALLNLPDDKAIDLPKRSDFADKGIAVDYCTFDRQIDPNVDVPPSLQLKAYGYYNLKLLKLHGSVSWLKCSVCDSLHIAFEMALVTKLLWERFDCAVCLQNLKQQVGLKLFQISPTFVKDLNNVHYRMIWWNAGFEIAEATHLVFIGYSLPLADFEFRNLLTRNFPNRRKVNIKVVLFKRKTRKNSTEEKEEGFKYAEEVQRYEAFFGSQISKTDFTSLGAFEYIRRLSNRAEKSIWEFHEEPWNWGA